MKNERTRSHIVSNVNEMSTTVSSIPELIRSGIEILLSSYMANFLSANKNIEGDVPLLYR
nr:MAG TPA: hypothetical protein [Caudoviricetes sp.]